MRGLPIPTSTASGSCFGNLGNTRSRATPSVEDLPEELSALADSLNDEWSERDTDEPWTQLMGHITSRLAAHHWTAYPTTPTSSCSRTLRSTSTSRRRLKRNSAAACLGISSITSGTLGCCTSHA